ncbi:hypothetical protein N7650_06425 [Pseudomonas sp. GD04058]|uniref:hypothetical protein n=1 Tax=Pseudomonas sp. GD04058 TaxID=2975429 RepID=UPI0024481F8F|nr:hypothetical protein [Pseudomonas sp. GD04058]MDG9882465.1 hypothetical protein [Pseudomonas sp. GD04058]
MSDDRIERYVRLMTDYLPEPMRPPPCPPAVVEETFMRFDQAFGSPLPAVYRQVWGVADGVNHNGLTIWPARHLGFPFQQTLIDANRDRRDLFDENLLYLAQLDEEFYVCDTRTGHYQAIEMVGMPVWKSFASAEEMFLFLLERAWGEAIR